MKFLAAYILRGRMQAMLVASSLALLSLLLPPVSIVSSASISLITLRRGGKEGLFVLICSCLSVALLGFFLFRNFQFALLYGLVLWFPIWIISIILREGKHLSVAIEIAVLLGAVGIVVFYLFVDDPASLWYMMLGQMIEQMIETGTEVDVSIDQVKQTIQMFSRYMTGGIALGSVYGLLFGLFLARMWQAALYNPGGFREDYLSLRVHSKVATISIIVVALAWLMPGTISEICWNISILFIVLYTFSGTAILHTAFSQMKAKRFMVPFLYIILILVPHSIAVVLIVGFVDVWLDLRNKFSNKSGT